MKKTKLLTSLVALALVLGLGACDGDININIDGDVNISGDSSSDSADTETSEDEEPTESGTTEGTTSGTTEGDNNPSTEETTNRDLLVELLSNKDTLLGVSWTGFHYYDGTEGGIGEEFNYEEGYITTDSNKDLYGYIDNIDDEDSEESHTYYLDGMGFFDNDGTKTYEEVQTKTFDGLLEAQLDVAYTHVETLLTVLETLDDNAVSKSLNNYTVAFDYAGSDSSGTTSSSTTYKVNFTSKGILTLLSLDKKEEDVLDVSGTPTTFTTTTKYTLETYTGTINMPSIDKSEFGYREFMATPSTEDSHYHVYDDGTVELHQVVMNDGDTNYGHCTKCGQTDLYTGAVSYAASNDGTYYVNKYTGSSYSTEDELYIVSEYDGCPVTQIGDPSNTTGSNGAFYMSSLTLICLPNTITRFNCGSFYSCTKLTSIYFPDGLTYIGNYAVANCSSLAGDIVIPEGVTYIGNSAFLSDKLVTSITFASNENLLQIGEQAFSSCTGLTTMSIPDSVTTMGEEVLKDCTGLVSVNFPASMETTPVGYLWGCSAISNVSLPDSITKIGKSTFRNCTGLKSFDFLPSTITEFGDSAFYGCTGITSFDWSKYTSLTKVGEYAFANTGLTEIVVPDFVTSIGNRAFYDCSSLVTATLGKGITAIPSYCFRDDSALTTVTIPSTITSINTYAFYNCNALTTVNFGGSEAEWTALLATAQSSGNNIPLLSSSLTVNYTNS